MNSITTRLDLPLTKEKALALNAGDSLLLNGIIYTARDAAHGRLMALLDRGEPLPFPLGDSIIYYVGPTPERPGEISGSAGPTTSYRMDPYTPALLDRGLRGMIGKGRRSAEVIEAMRRNGGIYFGATGGLGALLADRIRESTVVAFPDLGPEAIRRLRVEDFPVTVIIDSRGNNFYELGRAAYLASPASSQQ
jgi:fumarate hydratase subunit beta